MRHAVEQHFVGVGVAESEGEIALAGLGQRAGLAEFAEQLQAGLVPQGAKDVGAVVVALVERGRGGARRFCHGAHGERFRAAPGP